MGELQENGRFAMEQLKSAVHLSGYQGCADPSGTYAITLLDNTGANLQPNTGGTFNDNAIRGWEYDGTWSPALSPDVTAFGITPNEDTDVLAVQYADSGYEVVTFANGTPDSVTLTVPAGSTLSNDFPEADSNNANGRQYGILSDCTKADFVEVINLPTATSANVTNTSATYEAEAQLLPYHSVVFYIADSPARDTDGNFIPSLYATSFDGTANGDTQELIAGVENMQISYGEMDASNNVTLKTANTADMASVVMVRIGLLMTGRERVLTTDDVSVFNMPGSADLTNGSGYENDRKLRLSFSSTIKLRNRVVSEAP